MAKTWDPEAWIHEDTTWDLEDRTWATWDPEDQTWATEWGLVWEWAPVDLE
jgi:hypothetical protein